MSGKASLAGGGLTSQIFSARARRWRRQKDASLWDRAASAWLPRENGANNVLDASFIAPGAKRSRRE
jgi:hypothetical protein